MGSPKEKPGFFLVAQFVPDSFRAEGVNVGVVLVSPEDRLALWSIDKTNDRAKRLLGASGVDGGRLRVLKLGLLERLKRDSASLLEPERLDSFAKRFRNQLQLTNPRPCVVLDPEATLSELYERLVAFPEEVKAERAIDRKRIRKEFEDRLRARAIYDKLDHDIEMEARYKPHPYIFGHGYQNGHYQVVHEVSFAVQSADANCDRALALAGAIDDVRDHSGGQSSNLEFTVLTAFSPGQHDAQAAINRIFADRSIGVYPLDDVETLVEKVVRAVS